MHRNGLREKGGVILGISKQGKNNNQDFISFKGEGNVLVLAAAGKGKTSSIMANALVYNGSSVFNDPKGEITLRSVFSRANSLDQEIAIIDPFGECLKQVKAKLARIDRHIKKLSATNASAEVLKELVQARKFYEELLPCIDAQDGSMIKGINPMQYITALFLDGKYDEIYAEANILAESLVLKTDGQSEHWDERSRMIIRNAILFVTFSEAFEEGPKDLVTVRNFILKTFSSPELLDTMMAQCSTSIYSEYLEQIISEFTLIGGEELNGILSTTLKHTEFLDDPFVKKSVSRTDCDLSKLKHEKMTVYLVLPLNKTAAYGRLSRLWVSAILQSLTKDLFEPEERVLVVLDECASLGKVDLIEKGVSYLRQFGVNLYLVFQDLAQIKDIYGNRWETLATNCRFKQYLGVSDQSTAELLSKETGQKTLITKGSNVSESSSRGGGTNSTSKSQGYSTNVQAEPVMRPDELRRSTFQYIIPDEGFPIEAARLQYFNDSYLKAQLPFSLGADYKDI
ncbi:type IV secretory system conjugative DNA transfer family protein [Pedobacter sp. P26]|uniref:type IV secretory system conjugative DNA transfer family protein n=1 Tax=Pedobacter sp. P26 TaxID=3423956 RepID=UPI003D67FDCE